MGLASMVPCKIMPSNRKRATLLRKVAAQLKIMERGAGQLWKKNSDASRVESVNEGIVYHDVIDRKGSNRLRSVLLGMECVND